MAGEKRKLESDATSVFFGYKKNLGIYDFSELRDPFELKFHRDSRKNISFRFLMSFGIFERPVFVQIDFSVKN